jgi:hypothetical protein
MTLPATEVIGELIKKFLPGYNFTGDKKKSSFVASKKNLLFQQKISFSFMTHSSDGDYFSSMLQGMYNFYASIETTHKQVQKTLLSKIQLFNIMVIVAAERDMDDDAFSAVMSMSKEGNGLIFLPPGNLYTSSGDLVFNASGETDLDEYSPEIPAELQNQSVALTAELTAEIAAALTESAMARKARSLKILEAHSVTINKTLPPLVDDKNTILRTKEEIIHRSTALLMTAIYAEILRDRTVEEARALIKKTIDTYHTAAYLSPEENAFLEDDNPTENDIAKFIWRYECYWVALWALSFVDELAFPQNICNVSEMISFLHTSGSIKAFSDKATLRPANEIFDQADLIYRYNWACADAQINGHEVPAGLNPGVVVERYRMLSWIIRYMELDWDDVRTDA